MPDDMPIDPVWGEWTMTAVGDGLPDGMIPDGLPEPDVKVEGIVPLGYDRGVFFYLSRGLRQVVALPAERHTSKALMGMASIPHFWQRTRFVTEKTGAIQWEPAADWLMTECRAVGIFDPDRLRGRGAWMDGGVPVLHVGDALMVDGRRQELMRQGSRYVYEEAVPLAADLDAVPLSSPEAARLMDLCMAAPWEDPEGMGRLLAGWLTIAPVCGAMSWRPHLWLTSEAGGGKSWVLDNIVRPVLGEIALRVQSKTTEAGLRGVLGIDARPVVFDEFETQNDQDRARVQQVLDLARQASSEDGAEIVKGTREGGAKRYRIRSCFAFASINVGMSQAADESRTVVLTLMPSTDADERGAAFARLRECHAEIMTPDFGARLLARTLRLLPVIRENTEVFAQAIARTGAPRRTGDTLGVLLAGAWSLRSNKVATAKEADDYVTTKAWVRSAIGRSEASPEWRRALAHLVQHRLRVVPSNNKPEDVPIGELVAVAGGLADPGSTLGIKDAGTALARSGLRVIVEEDKTRRLYLANSSKDVADLFLGTAWAVGWLATIGRTPLARKEGTTAFGALRSRAISLPLEALEGEDDP